MLQFLKKEKIYEFLNKTLVSLLLEFISYFLSQCMQVELELNYLQISNTSEHQFFLAGCFLDVRPLIHLFKFGVYSYVLNSRRGCFIRF